MSSARRPSYSSSFSSPSSPFSSSHTSPSPPGFEDLEISNFLGVEAAIPPRCKCGLPSTLRMSRTASNPCRRFYKCNNCSFFIWLDPESQWYRYVVGALLTKKSNSDREMIDLKRKMKEVADENEDLQAVLHEYMSQVDESGQQVQTLRLELEKMEIKLKMCKIMIIVLIVLIVVKLM